MAQTKRKATASADAFRSAKKPSIAKSPSKPKSPAGKSATPPASGSTSKRQAANKKGSEPTKAKGKTAPTTKGAKAAPATKSPKAPATKKGAEPKSKTNAASPARGKGKAAAETKKNTPPPARETKYPDSFEYSFNFPRPNGEGSLFLTTVGKSVNSLLGGASDAVLGFYVAKTNNPMQDGSGLLKAMASPDGNVEYFSNIVESWSKQKKFSRSVFAKADIKSLIEVVDTTGGDNPIVLAKVTCGKKSKIPAPPFTFWILMLPCTFSEHCLTALPKIYCFLRRNLRNIIESVSKTPCCLTFPLLGAEIRSAKSKPTLSSVSVSSALDAIFILADRARLDFNADELDSIEIWAHSPPKQEALESQLLDYTRSYAWDRLEENIHELVAENEECDKEVRDTCRFIGASWDTCNYSPIVGAEALFVFVGCVKSKALVERWCQLKAGRSYGESFETTEDLMAWVVKEKSIPESLHLGLVDCFNNAQLAAQSGYSAVTLFDAARSINVLVQLLRIWTPVQKAAATAMPTFKK